MLKTLIAEVDRALYAAKAAGRNCAVSAEDPGINFVDGSRDVASVAVSGSTYNLWHGSLSAPIGEEVNIYLTTPGSAASIIISVDLVIRDA